MEARRDEGEEEEEGEEYEQAEEDEPSADTAEPPPKETRGLTSRERPGEQGKNSAAMRAHRGGKRKARDLRHFPRVGS